MPWSSHSSYDRFPGGGYTHAALKTVWNQLAIRQVFKTIAILRSLELLYTRSTLRVGLPDVWLKAACRPLFFQLEVRLLRIFKSM